MGEWKCEESWGCFDWGMVEGMCKESLLKFVSDVRGGKAGQPVPHWPVCKVIVG